MTAWTFRRSSSELRKESATFLVRRRLKDSKAWNGFQKADTDTVERHITFFKKSDTDYCICILFSCAFQSLEVGFTDPDQ